MYFYRYILKYEYSDLGIIDQVDRVINNLYAQERLVFKQIPDDQDHISRLRSSFLNLETQTRITLTVDYTLKIVYLDISSEDIAIFDLTQEIILKKLDFYSAQELEQTKLEDIEEYPGMLLVIAKGLFTNKISQNTINLIKEAVFHQDNNISIIGTAAAYNMMHPEFIPILRLKLSTDKQLDKTRKENIKLIIAELEKSSRAEELKKLIIRVDKINI